MAAVPDALRGYTCPCPPILAALSAGEPTKYTAVRFLGCKAQILNVEYGYLELTLKHLFMLVVEPVESQTQEMVDYVAHVFLDIWVRGNRIVSVSWAH